MSTARFASIHVHLLPELVEPVRLRGATVVVIDVLRATTTIAAALAAGAFRVIPCREIDEARRRAAEIPGARLGGERGGRPIDGFDFGNSPAEYTRDAIGGKSLVFTTTNGTRAMMRCGEASDVFLGAFVNLSAVCRSIATSLAGSRTPHLHLICAGTDGETTQEDVLLAGAIVDRVAGRLHASYADAHRESPSDIIALNDSARIASAYWRRVADESGSNGILGELRSSRGGRNLIELGMEADIRLAAQIDQFDRAARLDVEAWEIT